MLLQFAIENFRSIAGRQVLSWMAAPDEPHPVGQSREVEGLGTVLRSLVLYGPNASGKSNVVRALETARDLAVNGVAPGKPLPVVPHRLDPARANEPTRFELELWLDGAHYAYGLLATRERVVEEWLHRVDGDRDRTVFVRRDGGDRPRVDFGRGLAVKGKRRDFYRFVAEGTRPEQPLLAELRARNATELAPVFEFLDDVETAWPDEPFDELAFAFMALQYRVLLTTRAALLREADTGIIDIHLVADDPAVQRRIDGGEAFSEAEAENIVFDRPLGVRPQFLHRGAAGAVPLELHELSDGTRRLLELGYLLEFFYGDELRAIDELDRSMHTQLTRDFLDRLNRSARQGQFLFTTHDTNLLDANVFGRDAIWFVQKDEVGASRLYSLAEFDRAQLDALTGRIEEGYLQGRFGAVPFLGDPMKLGWTAR